MLMYYATPMQFFLSLAFTLFMTKVITNTFYSLTCVSKHLKLYDLEGFPLLQICFLYAAEFDVVYMQTLIHFCHIVSYSFYIPLHHVVYLPCCGGSSTIGFSDPSICSTRRLLKTTSNQECSPSRFGALHYICLLGLHRASAIY